jgi:hypothetical protein
MAGGEASIATDRLAAFGVNGVMGIGSDDLGIAMVGTACPARPAGPTATRFGSLKFAQS